MSNRFNGSNESFRAQGIPYNPAGLKNSSRGERVSYLQCGCHLVVQAEAEEARVLAHEARDLGAC